MSDIAVATQVMTSMNPQGVQGLRAMFGGNTQAVGGDVFAMIFQQMMAGSDMEMQELFAQMGQMQEEQQNEGAELGMQMMAEMLFGLPPEMQAQLLASQQSQAAPLTVGNPLNPAQQAVGQNVSPQDGAKAQEPTQETAQFQKILGEQTQAQQSQTNAESQGKGGQWQDQLNAQNAIQQAREKLGNQQKPKTQELDIDSLQASVDAKRFGGTAAVQGAKQLPEPNANEVLSQLKTGIQDNLSKGKNEFVVKLKPDGLGEITIKLMEQDNKISMSIVTSNTQVAKLLSNEVAALQNALRPLHAEVTQIVSQPQNASAQQDSLAGQSFANFANQHQGFYQDQPQTYYSSGGEQDTFDDSMTQAAFEDDVGLNAYI